MGIGDLCERAVGRPEIIAEEAARHASNPLFRDILDEDSRREKVSAAAERTAIERVLLSNMAAKDPRPISISVIEAEVARLKEAAGCRAAFHDGHVRFEVERRLRLQRLVDELATPELPITEEEIAHYYSDNRPHFLLPATFQSAQIICHVNERQSEEQAYAAISAALEELSSGVSFADVVERYSDCKGNGGLMPTYPAGEMVEEFEEAVHSLEPGQRTGIFDSPFGFHLAELRAKLPSRLASFDEVSTSIREVLTYERKRAAYEQAIESLLKKADIRRTGSNGSKAHKSA